MIVLEERRLGRPTDAELQAQEHQIRRWQLADLDTWLLGRLAQQWGADERFWRGKLAGYAASNAHLFVTNETAVFLGMAMPHAMTGKQVVMEVFCWSREAVPDRSERTENLVLDDTRDMRALYRHVRRWAQGLNATRMMIGTCSDMTPRHLLDLNRSEGYYIVAMPC